MHPALQIIDHRPWPLPPGEWRWRQSWLDLAFVHYRVEARTVQPLLPSGLRLQEFDGSAWIGLVPFRMAGVMRRPFPDLPGFSSFPELNVRTYVEVGGKPGVWFFSLDADSWPLVFGGRHVYRLPYFAARMQQRSEGEWIYYSSTRRDGGARFEARYRGVGAPFRATVGSFAHWATERYCLYSATGRGGIERVEVHHVPWPLQQGEIEIAANTLFAAAGLVPLGDAPVVHFSRGVDAVSFGSQKAV